MARAQKGGGSFSFTQSIPPQPQATTKRGIPSAFDGRLGRGPSRGPATPVDSRTFMGWKARERDAAASVPGKIRGRKPRPVLAVCFVAGTDRRRGGSGWCLALGSWGCAPVDDQGGWLTWTCGSRVSNTRVCCRWMDGKWRTIIHY